MATSDQLSDNMEVCGADGVHVGTIDHVEGDRIKLKKIDNPQGHQGHHHYLDVASVDRVEDGKAILSMNGSEALSSEQEESGEQVG